MTSIKRLLRLLAGTILASLGMASVSPPGMGATADQGATPAPAPSAASRPNIVVILADDLGYSDLGAFGSEINTPNIDALAAEGVQLTNFHSAPTCSPTRSMLMTGTDNHIAGIGTMAELRLPEQKGNPRYQGALDLSVATLPAALQSAGYHTLMAGKWHLGLTNENSPRARGFERSFAMLDGAADHFTSGGVFHGKPVASYREDGVMTTLPPDFGYSADFYTRTLTSYVDAVKDGKPFFAYLAYTLPHWPLQAPDAYLQRFKGAYDGGYDAIAAGRLQRMKARGLVPADVQPAADPPVWPTWSALPAATRAKEARRMEAYAAMVTALDADVGRFVRHLKDIGRYDNTVFVFFSDNGAEGGGPEEIDDENRAWLGKNFDNSLDNIGHRGSFDSYGPNWARVSSTPLRMFKAYTYEGGIRTPALVAGPGLRRGVVSDADVNVKDIMPTLLGIAGAPHPSEHDASVPPMQGRSLLPLLSGTATAAHPDGETRCLELFGRVAVRRDRWKLVYSNKPWGTGNWELFDVAADPSELHDVASTKPDVVNALLPEWKACESADGIAWSPDLAAKIRYSNVYQHFDDD